MLRLVVVVFFGKPRSEQAAQGSESPRVMIDPLIVLAIPAPSRGFGFFATRFLILPNEKERGLPCRYWRSPRCLSVSLVAVAALSQPGESDPTRYLAFPRALLLR